MIYRVRLIETILINCSSLLARDGDYYQTLSSMNINQVLVIYIVHTVTKLQYPASVG